MMGKTQKTSKRTYNDLENILKNGLESGSGKPVISINNTKEINFYRIE